MSKARTFAVLAAALLFAAASVAEARPGSGGRGGGGHGGARSYSHSGGHSYARPSRGGARIVVGVPFAYPVWRPAHYAAPVYYHPPPAGYAPAYAPAPVEYIEQPQAPQGDWFYCAPSRAYYPEVQDCPGGWQRVAPRPPAPQ